MHGQTQGAYRAHLAAGEKPCEACARFARRYENQRQLDIAHGRQRLVHKGPYIRMLRSLMRLGHSAESLSARLGRGPTWVKTFCNRPGQPKVRRPVAEEIEILWESLCMTIGDSSSAMKRAEAKGWLPPLAYEDIWTGEVAMAPGEKDYSHDRLDFDLVDECLRERDFDVKLSPLEKAECVRQWVAWGYSEASLCRITGWRPGRYNQTVGTRRAA